MLRLADLSEMRVQVIDLIVGINAHHSISGHKLIVLAMGIDAIKYIDNVCAR